MNRSYKNIGLTEREKAIWPPKESPLQEAFYWLSETVIVGTFVLLFLIMVAFGVFWYHSVHADEKETVCQAWANGAQVRGAEEGEVAEYCYSV